MHTPSAALAWELWHRHRTRVMTIVGLVVGFALLHPKLCALAGVNSNSPDFLEQIAQKFAPTKDAGTLPFRVMRILYLMFLTGGPTVAMFMSLLYVTWMFTFTGPDPKTKDPMTFPGRLFTLPVSTSFLFGWLVLGGMTAIVALYWSWIYLVPQPHLNIFSPFYECFGWMTLLALTQGIVWALAAWPGARMLMLIAVFFCFIFSAAPLVEIYESPYVLPSLFLLGLLLARAGLQKMRHGQWQGWTWRRPIPALAAGAELRGPRRFASPAQAQLWFEWRRFARRLCFYVAVLTIMPAAILLVLARYVVGLGPVQDDTISHIAMYLLAVPLLVHYLCAISEADTDQGFTLIRPLTNGQMVMATLKASGILTALSWAVVLAALAAMTRLASYPALKASMSEIFRYRTLILLGLVLLTWRVIAVNLCFVWSGNRRLIRAPIFMLLAGYAGAGALFLMSQNAGYWDLFRRIVPGLLSCLVVLKFLLAFLAFRASLKRGLLAPSSMLSYLGVWALLAAALLIPTAILCHNQPWLVTTCLLFVLLTPLARIGFCPITLAWNRHA
jgi:hypothetical protein